MVLRNRLNLLYLFYHLHASQLYRPLHHIVWYDISHNEKMFSCCNEKTTYAKLGRENYLNLTSISV